MALKQVVPLDENKESAEQASIYYDYPEQYRWILAALVILLTILIGPTFLSWPPLRDIFEASGIYNNLCSNPENLLDISCPRKTAAVEALGGTTASIFFSFTLVSGLVLDFVGAKLCTLYGLALNFLGWILIGVSGPSFNGFSAGMFLIAMSTDAIFFGIVCVSNLFPGYSSTVLSLLGASRSLSFAVPIVFNELFKAGVAPRVFFLTYAVIILLLFILTMIFIPFTQFPKHPMGTTKLDYVPGEDKISMRTYMKKMPKVDVQAVKGQTMKQVKELLECALQPTYLMFVGVLSIGVMRNIYVIETSKRHFGAAESTYTLLLSLSFIPCPVFGYIADRFGASLSAAVVEGVGSLTMAALIPGVLGLSYLAAFFNWMYVSFLGSQCYCFIAAVYPQKVMGKLTGLCLTVAGLVSFATTLLKEFADQSRYHLLIMDIIVTCFTALASIVCVGLYIWLERPMRRSSKQQKEAHQTESCKLMESAEAKQLMEV